MYVSIYVFVVSDKYNTFLLIHLNNLCLLTQKVIHKCNKNWLKFVTC